MALVGVMGSLVQAHEANVILRQETVALDAARSALDELRDLRAGGLSIPDGLLETVTELPEKLEDLSLNSAQRQYTFTKLRSGLLQVEAEISWRDMRGRPAKVSLTTVLGNHV
ncbi:MAG: hypothetical protein GC168_14340 [Candidatus Hydrogenedens sp.]|nr:hypothetical protein [Candidatus Hydrogenedens sp.]